MISLEDNVADHNGYHDDDDGDDDDDDDDDDDKRKCLTHLAVCQPQ